jgi:hypothetical protein
MNLQGDRKLGLVVLGVAVVPLLVALMAPAASAAPPPCHTKNVRTGVPYKGASALATAITAAAPGDTIRVWGTCFGNFALGKDLTLQGKGKPATLDGNRSGRVLNITAGTTATIRDLTITNGRTDGDGGAILIDAGASAALVDTTVRDSTAGSGSFGGGIEANGNLLLIRSEVTGNSAGSSGGIDMNGPATVSLINSSVTENTATHVPGSPGDGCGFADETGALRFACGGGIWNFNGTLSLTNSTVNANTAAYRGGGLRTSSTIQDGLVVSGITLLAGSTTIDGNTAGDKGGGIFVRLSPVSTPQETASLTFRVADGSPSYTDPLTGSTLPAWTGSVSGNTPDQCFPTLTLGTHSCGLTFD